MLPGQGRPIRAFCRGQYTKEVHVATLPSDYLDRVYAGVLGKIIGVYLGRPFEGWGYRRILKELGPVDYYVHERLGKPLIVTDDDISGTFTFVRALEDYAQKGWDLSAADVGQTWLNFIVEHKTVLWWGGHGLSTEHTAFNHLMRGVPAPQSGSMARNGRVVAEQIGAQIFIDGWAMVAPGRPDLAAELARKAGSVSHDGEAVFAAQVVAAMEAQAFVEHDLNKLLDVGTSFVPKDSIVYRMIADLREFRGKNPDWNAAMTDVMERRYGYDKYGGNCHVVPNHGLIVLALLYGEDHFQRSLMIANTCGWDTDCNSGNVGCLMGIKNGLAGIDAGPDWRGPVADRMYLPTADGGSSVTDAATWAVRLTNLGRRLAGEQPIAPKGGARFHFALPGSVQGFVPDSSVDAKGAATVENVNARLAIRYHKLAVGRVARVATATFAPPVAGKMDGYGLYACPTLSPGQTVTARLDADAANAAPVTATLFVRHYGLKDEPVLVHGPTAALAPGGGQVLTWTVPPLGGQPVFEVGVELAGDRGASGVVHLDALTWAGGPDVTLGTLAPSGEMWRRQWVDAVTHFQAGGRTDEATQAFTVIQNEGRGLAITGTRDWRDYAASTTLTPHVAAACGLAARVQGLQRYYAVLLVADAEGRRKVQLVKALDGERVLAEAPLDWRWDSVQPVALALTVVGNHIMASVDGTLLFDVSDTDRPLDSGGIAIVVEQGRVAVGPVTVRPA